MGENGICEVCGKEFIKRHARQKYCGPSCARYANRHKQIIRIEDPDAPVIRTFTCRRCGEEVRVTDPNDKRLKFCSQHCEKLFWKHPEKVQAVFVAREFHCKGCGKLVEVTSAFDRRHAFCSKECQIRYNCKVLAQKLAEKRKQREFNCAECGKPVKTALEKDRRTKFCSDICRQRYHARIAAQKHRDKVRAEKEAERETDNP